MNNWLMIGLLVGLIAFVIFLALPSSKSLPFILSIIAGVALLCLSAVAIFAFG